MQAALLAVDNAAANEMTLHILAAVAQAERKAISKRTKEALAAAKARGVITGQPAVGRSTGKHQQPSTAASPRVRQDDGSRDAKCQGSWFAQFPSDR